MAKTLDEAGVKRLIQEIKGANKNLNAPIPISTENTPESMAQNVKNIADYVAKAKAAGVPDVNGMAVTCIIDNDYSGVGYLYGDSAICGIKTNDALEAPSFFDVDPSGSYHENEVLVKGLSDQITSDMLVEGARKPIIITGDMTEVDEETYQKLLQEGTDVILNLGDGAFVELQGIFNTGDTLNLIFGYSQFDESNDGAIATFTISINTSAPHTLTLPSIGACRPVSKSTLTPVLKKINLRKGNNSAVIKQFEADWENLNGSVFGARFIGFPAGTLPVLFMKDNFNDCYIGYTDRNLDGGPDSTGPFKKITLCANDNYNLKVTDVPATVQYIDLNSTTTNLTSIGAVQQNTPHCFTYTKDSEIIKGVGQVWQSSSYGYLEGISFDGKYRVHAEVQANGAATVTLTSIGAQKLLQPVLQEIDLSGTDAERKAKLDQFETDWKALNGASDLTGARFVGHISTPSGNSSMIFTWNDAFPCYTGIGFDDTHKDYNCMVQSDGSLTITPLFSHLEAIKIYDDEVDVADGYAQNLKNITAYKRNLEALGVDTSKPYIIPIGLWFDSAGIFKDTGFLQGPMPIEGRYQGYVNGKLIYINATTGEPSFENLVINTEISPILEAITIKTGNTPDDKAANVAAIKSYVDNLKALGVDTTLSFQIPIYIYDNNYAGTLVKKKGADRYTGWFNLDNGFHPIVVAADGTYVETLTFTTDGSYSSLTTTSKGIIPAINEVNALAKGYSTPIELTTDPAQNKTAIDARVAAFTAQGISLTNGCCIPVTYKGVYAGNISLINGDWYGLLVKNTNNPADNINIKLSADGTITEGNSAQ